MSHTSLALLIIGCILVGQFIGILVTDIKGWKDISKKRVRKFASVGSEKALLNLFSNLASNENEPADRYLQMGVFFRQQGEYERAIKLHQGLLKRENLELALREQTVIALALDFEAVGMINKAVKPLEALLAEEPECAEARKLLIRLKNKEIK